MDNLNTSVYNNNQEPNMDTINLIRSFIFFVPGIAMLLFPKKVFNFQIYLIKKLGIKYNLEKEKKNYPRLGIIFIIISLILFVFSVTN